MTTTTENKKNALHILLKSVLFVSGVKVLFTTVLLFTSIQLNAQNFEFDRDLGSIYSKIIQLDLEGSKKDIAAYKIKNPDNYLVYHIENYIDFFRCFIDEDYEYFNSIEDRKDQRIQKIQQGDKFSPYYKFSQAEILLQWALVRLKFEEYTSALLEMNRAISLLEENDKLFPDFIANKKSLSALHALVGTIPDSYKNILSWVSSFRGTVEQGYSEINDVDSRMNAETFPFATEVTVVKALIELHVMNMADLAYQTVQNDQISPSVSPLICFIVANISHNAGKNDEAISILESYKPSLDQHPLYYLDYLKGIYKLNRLDDDSDRYIRRYLNYFQGRHYIKEAYQKLAWHAWVIEGDSIEYRRNMEFCLIHGEDLIDEDKQAQNLARRGVLPNRELLKVRLLSDGAYLDQALEQLELIDPLQLKQSHAIEYTYRKARVLQDLDRLTEAIESYKACLAFPYQESMYYQLAAHLYLGQAYENIGRNQAARYHYEQCLELKSSQYQSSLHQKAKVGALRIKDE